MTTRNRELASIIDDSGNITTGGNLSVTGNLTQSSSTTTTYSDGLLELNNGAGSNSNDLGLVMERGSTGDNAIFLWDESNDGFAVGTTTATGSATGNISFSAAPFTASTITGTILTGSTSVKTPLIEYTDGDDAITIADGGHITTGANLSIGGSNNELRFYEGSNYVGFEAPALSADQIWVLPTADGSSGQLLKTDGSGNLSFTDDLTLANASVNNFSGDGSTTGFTLSSTPVTENTTMAYINGVYQFKNTYSVSGTTFTFDAAPANGASIEIIVWSTVAVNVPADSSVTSAKLSGDLTLPGDLTLADSEKVIFGAGSDLQIFHSGTNSVIDNNTGGLYLRNNVASDVGGDIFIQAKSGENSATFTHDGAVTLMHDNVTKFATTSSGIQVTGLTATTTLDVSSTSVFDNNIAFGLSATTFASGNGMHFADAFKAGFGTGNGTRPDFQISGDNNGLAFACGTGSDDADILFTTAGLVGIGTTSPSNLLHASGTGSTRLQIDATDNNAAGAGLYMKVLNSGSLVGNATVRVDNAGNIDFFNGTSSESKQMVLQADGKLAVTEIRHISAGNLEIGNDDEKQIFSASSQNITFQTGDTERLRIDSEGLKFNGDTNVANALDDYEEGSWTPVCSTSNVNSSITTTVNFAKYIKVGGLVHISAYMTLNISDVGTGAATVTGLPFTATSGQGYSVGSNAHGTALASATTHGVAAYVTNGTTQYRMVGITDAANPGWVGTGYPKYLMIDATYHSI